MKLKLKNKLRKYTKDAEFSDYLFLFRWLMMYKSGSKYVSNLCGSEDIVPQQVDKMFIQLVKDHLVFSYYKRPGEKKQHQNTNKIQIKLKHKTQYNSSRVISKSDSAYLTAWADAILLVGCWSRVSGKRHPPGVWASRRGSWSRTTILIVSALTCCKPPPRFAFLTKEQERWNHKQQREVNKMRMIETKENNHND